MSQRDLAPGTMVVAGYRIESLVGRGGMGVVYRARELDLDRVVALKVIAPELVEDDAIRERFLREARAAAAIEHPHVIPVHAAGEADGLAFLAMRFVDGRRPARAGPARRPAAGRRGGRDRRAGRPPGSTRSTAAASCTATSSPRTC